MIHVTGDTLRECIDDGMRQHLAILCQLSLRRLWPDWPAIQGMLRDHLLVSLDDPKQVGRVLHTATLAQLQSLHGALP